MDAAGEVFKESSHESGCCGNVEPLPPGSGVCVQTLLQHVLACHVHGHASASNLRRGIDQGGRVDPLPFQAPRFCLCEFPEAKWKSFWKANRKKVPNRTEGRYGYILVGCGRAAVTRNVPHRCAGRVWYFVSVVLSLSLSLSLPLSDLL